MNNFKKIIKPLSKLGPMTKKVIPTIGNFLSAIDLVDNIVRLAKPFFDDVRDKSIEDSKKIYAYQINTFDCVTVYMKNTNIEVSAETEEEAFRVFISKLSDLEKNRILSSNRKIQKEEIKLIKKIDDIRKSGEDFRKYLFRIIVESEDLKKTKFSLSKIKIEKIKKM